MSGCNCYGFTPGADTRECFNCGRELHVDASQYTVFDLATGFMADYQPERVEWPGRFSFTYRKRSGKIRRMVAGADRAAQLEMLLETA